MNLPDFRFWPKADLGADAADVGFWQQSRLGHGGRAMWPNDLLRI
jgi:hypothetical protein